MASTKVVSNSEYLRHSSLSVLHGIYSIYHVGCLVVLIEKRKTGVCRQVKNKKKKRETENTDRLEIRWDTAEMPEIDLNDSRKK